MKERFLGEIIKQRRQELGITQAELCEGICEPPTFFQLLPGFIMMIAECDYNLGDMENSKELFIETYYLSKAVMDSADTQIAADALKEYFGYEI